MIYRILRTILAVALVLAGAQMLRFGYDNLNPEIDGKRPEVVEAQRTPEEIEKARDAGENPVRRMMGDSGPYVGKMGLAAGQLLAGVVLMVAAWKIFTREKVRNY